MKIHSDDFRVREGVALELRKWPTRVAPVYKSKEQYHAMLDDHIGQLSEQQSLLYADDRYAVLFIFQAMDAAGKDGVIKHVMSGVNPQGCQVFSFKHPSAQELQHGIARVQKCIQPFFMVPHPNGSYGHTRKA
jgi:polyphosphate kinase 2 (PPK2 family)